MDTSSSPTSPPRFWTPLLALTALALVMRFWRIGHSGLWLDEFVTLEFALREPLAEKIHESLRATTHPPLYYLGMSLWVKLVGTTETALRASSALVDGANVVLLGLIGRRLGWKTPLIAAALYAVAYTPLFFAQEARPYTGLIFLTLVLALGLLCTDRPLGRSLVLTCPLLLAQTHYFGLLSSPALLPFAWSVSPHARRRGLLKLAAAGAVISALSYIFYLPHLRYHLTLPQGWIPAASWRGIGELPFWGIGPLGPRSGAFLFLITLGGTFFWGRHFFRRDRALLLGLSAWWLTFPLFALIFGEVFQPIWVPRYFVAGVPALFLAWGTLLSRLTELSPKTRTWAVFCVAALWAGTAAQLVRPSLKGFMREGMLQIQEMDPSLPVVGCVPYGAALGYYTKRILAKAAGPSGLCAAGQGAGIPHEAVWFVRLQNEANPQDVLGPDWETKTVFEKLDTRVDLCWRRRAGAHKAPLGVPAL